MLKAIKHISAIRKGKTRPQLFECDDGRHYVVKFMSNPAHGDARKILVHELIANKLAKDLGLPVAEGQVIYFSSDLIKQVPELEEYNVQPGPHFGSVFYENKSRPTNKERIKKCVNLSEMPGVIVFDHWVHNRDRANNLWNLIIDEGEEYNKLYMIDHAGCFYSSRRDAYTLRKRARSIDIYWGKMYQQFKPFLKEKENFFKYVKAIENFSNSKIKEIVYSTPDKWEANKDELDAIYEYLIKRKSILKETINLLLKKHL